jgi:hypothetical protein
MTNLYIPLVIIFAAFGAFCFNMGHRRAYKVVLKSLLKGQIGFLSQRVALLTENKDTASQENLTRAFYSYESVGQLVIGWYKYFGMIRDDKELITLKRRIKELLEGYLSLIEIQSGKDVQ